VLSNLNHNSRYQRSISTDALRRLEGHDWPGNIRELANTLERSRLVCRDRQLEADDLLISEPVPAADPLSLLPEPREGFSLESFLKSARKQLLLRALEKAGGRQSQAARLLDISPQAVNRFFQENPENFNEG
jgi:two-component system response regulator AtoC